MNHVGMASACGQHQSSLVVLIESRVGVFMASFEEDDADVAMAEGGGEMEVRVGETLGARVGVM
jgi:hypothetical protein